MRKMPRAHRTQAATCDRYARGLVPKMNGYESVKVSTWLDLDVLGYDPEPFKFPVSDEPADVQLYREFTRPSLFAKYMDHPCTGKK